MRTNMHPVLKVAIVVASVLLLCEFAIYYLVIIQCSWPSLETGDASKIDDNDKVLKAFFISDPHLLGSRLGHWLDKLRREWQMTRAFQAAMTILNPEAVFVLGDLTDEGKWARDKEFDDTIQRFWTMFYHDSSVKFYTVAGNHDIGFHDFVSSHLKDRFDVKLKTSSVRVITIKDIVFVLLNSMTMHRDMCSVCSPATEQLRHTSMQLNCTRYGTPNGQTSSTSKKCDVYKKLPNTPPILLQHIPLWRESDEMCTGVDAPPLDERYLKFKPGFEALPPDASQRLLSWIRPRLILSGHTHYSCHVVHDGNIPEISVPSLSWRNLNNPSIILATISKEKYEIRKCFLPRESTVFMIYVMTVFGLVVFVFSKPTKRMVSKFGIMSGIFHAKTL